MINKVLLSGYFVEIKNNQLVFRYRSIKGEQFMSVNIDKVMANQLKKAVLKPDTVITLEGQVDVDDNDVVHILPDLLTVDNIDKITVNKSSTYA